MTGRFFCALMLADSDKKDGERKRMNTFQENTLIEILADMDLPSLRRDFSKPENVRWLLRNMAIRNRGHKDFSTAFTILKKIA